MFDYIEKRNSKNMYWKTVNICNSNTISCWGGEMLDLFFIFCLIYTRKNQSQFTLTLIKCVAYYQFYFKVLTLILEFPSLNFFFTLIKVFSTLILEFPLLILKIPTLTSVVITISFFFSISDKYLLISYLYQRHVDKGMIKIYRFHCFILVFIVSYCASFYLINDILLFNVSR